MFLSSRPCTKLHEKFIGPCITVFYALVLWTLRCSQVSNVSLHPPAHGYVYRTALSYSLVAVYPSSGAFVIPLHVSQAPSIASFYYLLE